VEGTTCVAPGTSGCTQISLGGGGAVAGAWGWRWGLAWLLGAGGRGSYRPQKAQSPGRFWSFAPRAAEGGVVWLWFQSRVFLWKQGGFVASSRGSPEAQGPPPPGALTAPWWQVKPPLAPGGLRGTALGPPFPSARVQRGTTKTRRFPSPATAAPRSTARRQPRLATHVGGFGALFHPHADPTSATEVKTN
jgi:hypothetical protein